MTCRQMTDERIFFVEHTSNCENFSKIILGILLNLGDVEASELLLELLVEVGAYVPLLVDLADVGAYVPLLVLLPSWGSRFHSC